MPIREVYRIKWPMFWRNELVEKHIHEWVTKSCFSGHSVKVCGCGKTKGSKADIITYQLWEKLDQNQREFKNHDDFT